MVVGTFESNGYGQNCEAQDLVPGCGQRGLVVLLDVGNPTDIHPADKQTVGQRQRWALAETHGREYSPTGPKVRSVTGESSCVVELDHAVGLATSDGVAPGAFEVSSDKRSWQSAKPPSLGIRSPLRGMALCRLPRGLTPADANVVNADGLPMRAIPMDQI